MEQIAAAGQRGGEAVGSARSSGTVSAPSAARLRWSEPGRAVTRTAKPGGRQRARHGGADEAGRAGHQYQITLPQSSSRPLVYNLSPAGHIPAPDMVL